MQNLFRPYRSADYQACMAIFDANCPDFFAPNERPGYAAFLDHSDDGYEVCEVNGQIVGAFGLLAEGDEKRLNWILIDPHKHRLGLGSKIMNRVIQLGHRFCIAVKLMLLCLVVRCMFIGRKVTYEDSLLFECICVIVNSVGFRLDPRNTIELSVHMFQYSRSRMFGSLHACCGIFKIGPQGDPNNLRSCRF